MAYNIGAKISLDGGDALKETLRDIIQQYKTLTAELKTVEAAMDREGKTQQLVQSYYEKRSEKMHSLIELENTYAQAVELSAKVNGENARETNYYREQLAKAATDIEHLTTETTKFFYLQDELEDALKKAQSEFAVASEEVRTQEAVLKRGGAAAEDYQNYISKLAEAQGKAENVTSALNALLEKSINEYGENSAEANYYREQLQKMATTTERLTTEILSYDYAEEQLQDTLKKAQGEFDLSAERLKTQETLLKRGGASAGELGKYLRELTYTEQDAQKVKGAYNALLEKSIKEFGENSAEANSYRLQLQKVNTTIEQLATKRTNAESELEKMFDEPTKEAGEFDDVLKLLGISFDVLYAKKVFEAIANEIKACTQAALEYETVMAGVSRTTGLIGNDLDDMQHSFEKLSTQIPVSVSELGALAETAGQLGIENGKIREFTETIAKLATATKSNASTIATQLAQFAGVTNEYDFERIGSTIAKLGDETATTTQRIVEMAQQFSGTATVAGFTAKEIFAIATAATSIGSVQPRSAATGLSRLVQDINKAVESGSTKLQDFASIAGMSAAQFKKAWSENTAEALHDFIRGLNEVERNGKSAILLLDDLEINQQREIAAILGMASGTDNLRIAIDKANEAWEENTALSEKANVMFSTNSSQIEMFKNAVSNLRAELGEPWADVAATFARDFTPIVVWFTEWLHAARKAPEIAEENAKAAEDAANAAHDFADAQDRVYVGVTDFTDLLTDKENAFMRQSSYVRQLRSDYDTLTGTLNETISKQISLYNDLAEDSTVTLKTVQSNLNTQVEYFKRYYDNVDALLSTGIDGIKEFVSAHADGTAQSAALFAELAKASRDEIAKVVSTEKEVKGYSEKISEHIANIVYGYDEAKAELDRRLADVTTLQNLLYDKYYAAGQYAIQGYIDGFESKAKVNDQVQKAVALKGKGVFETALGIDSPSKEYYKDGGFSVEGYTNGMYDKMRQSLSKIRTYAAMGLQAWSSASPIGADIARYSYSSGGFGGQKTATSNVTNLGGITITVQAAAGQDVNQIANAVADVLQQKLSEVSMAL